MEKTVQEVFTSEIVVEKSRFLTFLVPLTAVEDVEVHLSKAVEQYKGARHYCYAYRFGEQEKYSDDGEPRNTAGLPLLTILQKQNINDALLLVIRYFGGKKLGAGRLLRTYMDAGMSAVNVATFYNKIPGLKLTLKLDVRSFDEQRRIISTLGEIVNTRFDNFDVYVDVLIRTTALETLTKSYNVINKEETNIFEVIT